MNYYGHDCNRKCCGTCEYYTGKRKVSTGFSEDIMVEVQNEGLCSKQWNNPEVKERDGCLWYKKAIDIETAQKQIELKKIKKNQEIQQRENEKKLRQIDKVKNSDTKTRKLERTSNNSSKKGFVFGALGIFLIVIIGVIVGLFIPKDNLAQLTGENKVIAEYIVQNGIYDKEFNEYSITKNISIDGQAYKFEIVYNNEEDANHNFITYVTSYGDDKDKYDYLIGCLYFTYGEDLSSINVNGIASFDDGFFYVYYYSVNYDICPNLSYERAQISNFSGLTVTDEIENISIAGTWENIEICAKETNNFLKSINPTYILWN